MEIKIEDMLFLSLDVKIGFSPYMDGIGNVIDIVPPPTPYNFDYKNEPPEELEKLRTMLPYAENDFDLDYFYGAFGCTNYNAEHPQKILDCCDVLSDYRFGDLFEEVVGIDYSKTFPCSAPHHFCDIFGRRDVERVRDFSKVGNVQGIDYLILTPDDKLEVPYHTNYEIFVEDDGTRLFKMKDDYIDVAHDLKICGENGWKWDNRITPRYYPYVECLRDVIERVWGVYYHDRATFKDVIEENMVLKFVPSDVVVDEGGNRKYVLSLDGLLTYRYNPIC